MNKVLIFTPFALENKRGGEFFSLELTKGLQKFYDVSLIDTNRVLEKNIRLMKKRSILEINNLKRVNFATFRIFNASFDIIFPKELIKLYKEVKKRDIIYILISTFKTEFLFMIFSLLLPNKTFIIGYHKPLHSDKRVSLYNLKYRMTILFFKLFNHNIYHHALSLHAKKFLENFYNSNKIILIREGLDLSNFLSKEKEETKRDNILNFLYVGTFDDVHKGFKVLLNGIEQFLSEHEYTDIFFEFCGKGPLESELINLKNKFPSHIKIHGFIDTKKLSFIYKKNDVLLFSSRKEPFGRVLVEALASKMIIICTKTIGSIEILKGKEFAFFLKELTPEAIKKKISEVHELWKKDFQTFKRLQENARVHALSNYSLTNEINQFRDFFERKFLPIKKSTSK